MPVVSIIVPNYNHEFFLKERIDSILNQTLQDFELIILDDLSRDNSVKIIEQYRSHPKVSQIVYNDVNSGSTFKQWEKGLRLSTADIIWIAESDDFCDPGFLEKLLPEFSSGSDVGIVYCQSYRVNENGEIKGTWLDWTNNMRKKKYFEEGFLLNGIYFISQLLIYRNVIPNASAVLFRKSVFLKAGGISEDVKTNGDWLLWLKIAMICDVSFTATPLNYFRYHQGSVIANAKKSSDSMFLGSFDRHMRNIFQQYLLKFDLEKSTSIMEKNKQLTAASYLSECEFFLKQDRKYYALLCILKASFYAGFTLKYVVQLAYNYYDSKDGI